MLTRRAVVAAKIETTEGTAETLAAGDANFLVVDPKFDADIPLFKRGVVNGSLSPYNSIPGSQMARLSFKVELRGSGAAGTAPAIGKLLKACGFGETIVASTSVTYDPISTGVQSLTMALYRDGIKKQLRGARGTVKYDGKGGEPGMLDFSFQGVYDGVSDVALLTGSGIETTNLPALLNAAFSIASFQAKISSISIDIANKLAIRSDINKAEGYSSCLITGREPKGSFDPDEELVATHDWYGRFKAGTLGALTFKYDGGAGNICTITAPKLQYAGISEGNREDIATLGVDFLLTRSVAAGNDEVKFAFT
ncbi:MAG: hypothetical protein IT393_07305 [Nitrospirae bacterium]|nr:hypothetical protein [Nitrospirota bacterium]